MRTCVNQWTSRRVLALDHQQPVQQKIHHRPLQKRAQRGPRRDMMSLSRPTPFLPPPQLLPHLPLQRPLRRLPYLLFILFLFFLTSCSSGVTGQHKDDKPYPQLGAIPVTTFNCVGQAAGYYADPDTGCQVYHMCDTLEKQYSYLCPNHTLFNQKFMVCDHWYMVNCSSAQDFYHLNHHIGEVGGGSTGANTIQVSAVGGNDARDTSPKDTKTSSPLPTFKSSWPEFPKSRVPSTQQTVETTRPTIPPFTTPRLTRQPLIMKTTTPPLTTKKPVTSGITQSITATGFQYDPNQLQLLPTPLPLTQPITLPTSFTSPLKTITALLPTAAKAELPKPITPPYRGLSLPNIQSRINSQISALEASDNLNGTQLGDNTSTRTGPTRERTDPQVETSFNQTPRSKPPFTMMPGRVARRPGNKFAFTSIRNEQPPLSPKGFQGIPLRPLVVRPPSNTQTFLTTTPEVTRTSTDQVTQHSTPGVLAAPLTFNIPPLRDFDEFRIPTTFLQPPSLRSISHDFGPLQPPAHQNTTSIRHVNQEFPTPLFTPGRNRNSRLRPSKETVPEALHIQFSSRGNRDFFIPTAGLSLPAPDLSQVDQNNLGETPEHPDDDHHHHHHGDGGFHMTMVFPAPLEERMAELQLKPECPRCHPVFLRPGECHPCVLIK
nr:mucin-3A-like [Procambarus clarkii]